MTHRGGWAGGSGGLSRLWSSVSWPTRQLAILQPKVHHDPVPIPGRRHGYGNVSVLRSYGYWGLQGLLRGMDKEVYSRNTYTFTHRHNEVHMLPSFWGLLWGHRECKGW